MDVEQNVSELPAEADLDGQVFDVVWTQRKLADYYGESVKNFVSKVSTAIEKRNLKNVARASIGIMSLVCYMAFFVTAMIYHPPFGKSHSSNTVFFITIGLYVSMVYTAVKPQILRIYHARSLTFRTNRHFNRIYSFIRRQQTQQFASIVLGLLSMSSLILIALTSSSPHPYRTSLGIVFLLGIVWISSKNALAVNGRIIFSGLLTQLWLGCFIFKTNMGMKIIDYMVYQMEVIGVHSEKAASFVYGLNDVTSFAVSVTSSLIVISSLINLLYYWNVMQRIVYVIGWILSFLIGISAVDGVLVAANMFLAMTEAPLTIRPFLELMTPSEITTLMTAGLASVASPVLFGYMKRGVTPRYLICACILITPCSLTISKISHPEIYLTKATLTTIRTYDAKPCYRTAAGALLSGAVGSLPICGAIIASVVSSVSMIKLTDTIVLSCFNLVNITNFPFTKLMSMVFYPAAYIAGVSDKDAYTVASIVGSKTIFNEFLAFEHIANIAELKREMKKNNTFELAYCGLMELDNRPMMWEHHSEIVAMHAVCGFANIASIGLMLSIFPSLAPLRKCTAANNILRSFFCACVANLINACIASILSTGYDTQEIMDCNKFNYALNTTEGVTEHNQTLIPI